MSQTVIGDVSVTTTCSCVAQYEWEVKNYWICCFNVGDMIVSPEFIAAHDTNPFVWIQLIFYPKGKTEEVKDYFSLFVKIISRSVDADIQGLSLSIFNDNFKLITQPFLQPTEDDPMLWGCADFVNRDIIRTTVINNKGCSDNLTIGFLMNAACTEKRMKTLMLVSPIEIVNKDYQKMVESESFYDIELLIEGKSFSAHKLVLSNRSPVFAEIIMNQVQGEQENEVEQIEIPPIHRYEVFMEMLRYMYTERVQDIDDIADELLVAANEYKIPGLKRVCENSLIKDVDIDNVIAKLELAHACDAELLKVETIAFIAAHADDMIQREDYVSLAPEIAHDVFTADANRIL